MVKGGISDKESDIHKHRAVNEGNSLWLSNNLVGIVTWGGAIPSLPCIYEGYGIWHVKITRLGIVPKGFSVCSTSGGGDAYGGISRLRT